MSESKPMLAKALMITDDDYELGPERNKAIVILDWVLVFSLFAVLVPFAGAAMGGEALARKVRRRVGKHGS